jgi:membrane protein
VQRPTAAVRRQGRLSRGSAFVRTLTSESIEDRLLGLAAETAFFAVLSIFPALLIAAGLLGVLDVLVGADVTAGAKSTVVATLDAVLTDEAAGVVASVEDLFQESRGSVLTFATLGALVTLSGAFAVVIDALNRAYDTVERRTWIRRRLLGLLMGIATMTAVVLALAVLVVGPFFGRGEDLADLVGLGPAFSFAWNVLRLPVLFVGLVLWATALFHYAPNRHSRWRESLPGAFMTAVLWIVASLGFHLYLSLVAGANPVLGAFGGGVIVMTWVYLLSFALLLGGELNATLRRRTQRNGCPHAISGRWTGGTEGSDDDRPHRGLRPGR